MATSGQEINAETARWLADTVRSVLRDQLDEAARLREAVPLVDALEHNAKVLEREQLRVSQAYVLFASGLGAAIIAILALVPAAL